MGETQEEDRRLISDLIAIKMQQALTNQTGFQIPKRSSITQLPTDSESNPSTQQPDTQQQQQTPQPQFTSKPVGFLQRMGSISGSTITSVASSIPGIKLNLKKKNKRNQI